MTGTPATDQRKPRKDAVRNRSHILDVADRYFTEHGIHGSLDAIAREAGIGPGTLYRHFPTREALLAALLTARNEALVTRREAIEAHAADPATALEQWLEALAAWVTAFDGLPEPLREALGGDASALTLTCQGFVTTTESFLRAAQDAGVARRGVRGRDLFLGVLASCWVSGAAMADDDSAGALGGLLRDGWRGPTTTA